MLFDTETREAALVSLAIPFRVKGTLANPTAAPDPMAVIGAATKIFGGFSGSGGSSASSGNDAISSVLGGFLGGKKKKKKSAPAPQPQPAAAQVDVCAKLGVI